MNNKCLSKSKRLFSGVTQVSISGLLFVTFFNEIVLELNQSKIIKHADDTEILFAEVSY